MEKKESQKIVEFFKTKKGLNTIFIILFIIILLWSSSIRLQNLPLLKDTTTGKTIPLALDPYYFLRIAETKIANGGVLPSFDPLRKPFNVGWSEEILPNVIILMHKIFSIFGDYSLQEVDVISPVIFFALGLIVFFYFAYLLTNSKTTALLSALFLGFIPSYLYRTMGGFSDHEAIGMLSLFILLSAFSLSLKYLNEKATISKYYKIILFSLGISFLTSLTIASWGGIGKYCFMIIPLSFFIFWLIKTKNLEKIKKNTKEKFLLYYILWIIFTPIFGAFFGYPILKIINSYILSSQGVFSVFVLVFILIDYLLIYLIKKKINIFSKKEITKYRPLIVLIISFFIGMIGILLLRGDLIGTFNSIFEKLLRPSGTGRLGVTVAENKAPFLKDWINQLGIPFFIAMLLGLLFLGINLSKNFKKHKNKLYFIIIWVLLISGILFSRVSPNNILNGENLISKLFYFGTLTLFLIGSFYLYLKENLNIKPEMIIIFSWMIFMLISVRGAIRQFFLITPFAVFIASYSIENLFFYWKKSKDEIIKVFLIVITIILCFLLALSLMNFIQISSNQGKNTGPSANIQWQKAMQWVRENTNKNAIFVHWWDYGYWIEYLGERPTIADGGHFQGVFRDHLIGRYVLTSPNPNASLSFMKSNNISYLLIDPTDFGKYSAYSSIGSGPKMNDRASQIPIMNLIPEQTKETSDKIIMVYQGGAYLDKDILYQEDKKEIFLPEKKAIIIGVIIEKTSNGTKMLQPQGVFMYNNQQYRIPIKNIYYNKKLYSFEKGINATFVIIPKINSRYNKIEIDQMGAGAYLSPKVSQSLFAQLYLMNDPLNRYPTIKLAHKEADPLVESINSQGGNLDDFVIYGGFRGPIKIWKIDYPSNILTHKEFSEKEVKGIEYGGLDTLQFSD